MRPRSPATHRSNGFTLLEVVIVTAIIAILLSVVMKSTNGMLAEGQISKAEQEISTLKSAVTSYWRNNGSVYPPNIHAALVSASPKILDRVLTDPWNTDTTNNTYGYLTGTDSTVGPWFVIYTKGPRGDTTAPVWDSGNQRFTYTGSGLATSNLPVARN